MTTILRIKLRCLSRNETTALAYLSQGRETASCHIQRRCSHPDAQTTRRMLKRLQRDGLIAGVESRSGRVYWWRITDAGRAVVAEAA
jgi:DNA-binding PadR family transcriptional regulator